MSNSSKIRLALGEKACSRCEITKPLNEFSRRKNVIDGRLSWCKACASISNAVYAPKHYQENRDRKLRMAKSYYAQNRLKVKYQHMLKKYGITEADYERLL